ncbi:MAG: hypothetical protein JWM10_1954 [Myxococcaceae bacterium]|nr:hypothetical protein [Myxococcaceae bacterium]
MSRTPPRSAATTTSTAKGKARPAVRPGAGKRAVKAAPANPPLRLIGETADVGFLRGYARSAFDVRIVDPAAVVAGGRVKHPGRATIWLVTGDDATVARVFAGLAGVVQRGDTVLRFDGTLGDEVAAPVREARAGAGALVPLRWKPGGAPGRDALWEARYAYVGDGHSRGAARRLVSIIGFGKLLSPGTVDVAKVTAAVEIVARAVIAATRAGEAVLRAAFDGALSEADVHDVIEDNFLRFSGYGSAATVAMVTALAAGDPVVVRASAALAGTPNARALYRAALAVLEDPDG